MRLTAEQITELEDGLNHLLPWAITYGHLECFEKTIALGFRAVRDLRQRRSVSERDSPGLADASDVLNGEPE